MFSELKIVELASVLAGPSVGQFFSELGADVIKIENAKSGGDVTRSWKLDDENTNDRSAYFCSVNWGKRTIDLDLKIPSDLNKLYELIKEADIVIASYKPGDAEKLGVDYSTIKQYNPSIIFGRITGFGADNDRVGYDAIIQAEYGFMSMNGEPAGEPLKMPVALMDVLAAHQLKEAILLAIIHKSKTGDGSLVEVSLADAAIASLANQATNFLVANHVPQRIGSAHPNIAPYGEILYSKDRIPFVLAVGSDNQFTKLCDVFNLFLHKNPKFSENKMRVKHRNVLKGELHAIFSSHKFTDIEYKLLKNNIPFGRIRDMKEVCETSNAKNMILDSQGISAFRTNAFKLSFFTPITLTAPPKLGS